MSALHLRPKRGPRRLHSWRLTATATIVPALVLLGGAAMPPPAGPGTATAAVEAARPRPSTTVPPPGSPPPATARPVHPTPAAPHTATRPPGPASHRPDPTRPAPFVHDFARKPKIRPLAPLPSPTAPYRVAPNLDGCDRNYGSRTQCVPWTFPPGTADRCAWLAAHGFKPLPVVGRDRLRLDTNHDGVGCGPGDR